MTVYTHPNSRLRLCNWLIRRLAGSRMVIINASLVVAEPITVKSGDVISNTFVDQTGRRIT